jgi:Predicted pyridoxal phosphate-dependent enzyme apparently involved in regulation of cell wall biogenesis
MAMLSLGLKKGDEVIVPAFTWITTANCAEYVGAKAVFADVEFETYNIDPEAFKKAITRRTRAVIAVHLFGLSAKMREILAIAKKHGLFVIEDAACAIGTTYDNKPVGSLGDIACFSFHPRKIITTGEGGMITTNSRELADKIYSLRNHGSTGGRAGSPRPYEMATFNMLGYNYRLSDINASVGVAQMLKLEGLLAERKSLACRYSELLSDIKEISLPKVTEKCGHTYQSYVVRALKGGVSKRNAIMDHLASLHIETRPGTHAVHRLGYYADKYRIKPKDFPIAAECEDTTITLPMFPGMTDKEQKFVVNGLKKSG